MTKPSRIAQNVARAGEAIALCTGPLPTQDEPTEPQEWPDVMAYVRETTKDLEGQG